MPNIGDLPVNSEISQLFVPGGYVDLPKIAPPPTMPDTNRVRIFAVDSSGVASLVYQSDTGFTARILRDQLFIAYNGLPTMITKGTPVCSAGLYSNAVSLGLAKADSAATEAIAIAAQDIAAGTYGRVMVAGRLDGINTTAFAASGPVWLSAITAGGYAATPPTLPSRVQQIGSIIIPGSATGAIRVDVRNSLAVGLPNGFAFLDGSARLTTSQLPDLTDGYFGDGSDGDVTIAGTVTLARDMFYKTLTVSAGATLKPNGYRVCVAGTLTNNGTIDRKGNAGSGTTAGAALPSGTLGASGAGGNGGSAGQSGTAGSGVTTVGGTVGLAGAGGTGTKTAGAAGTVTAAGPGGGTIRSLPFAAMGAYFGAGGTGIITGGPGGGGGSGAASTTGGGGGSGGGPLVITARRIVNAGTITAAGGAGGNVGTGAGSGGGGGGGPVVVVYNVLAITGTITAAGGAAGTGGNVGTAGAAGAVIMVAT